MPEKRFSCPICQRYYYKFVYMDENDNVIGCSECVRAVDESLYQEQVESQLHDEHIDFLIDEAMGN